MEMLSLIVGLFMIGIGFLVKSVPDLIAGYNTMSKEQKEKVDIEGLSTFLRNGLIAIGISIIAGYYLFKWIGFTLIANSILLIVTLVGVIVLVIKAQKFDHNTDKKTKRTYFILGFIFIFVIGLIAYGFIPSKVIFDKDSVQFSGMYGVEIKIAEIDNVKLVDNLPKIKMRTNGFSFGTVKKGYFDLNEFGESRLLIHSEKPPYLIISKRNGEKTIINFEEKSVTESTYAEIKTLIEKK